MPVRFKGFKTSNEGTRRKCTKVLCMCDNVKRRWIPGKGLVRMRLHRVWFLVKFQCVTHVSKRRKWVHSHFLPSCSHTLVQKWLAKERCWGLRISRGLYFTCYHISCQQVETKARYLYVFFLFLGPLSLHVAQFQFNVFFSVKQYRI